MEEGRKAQEGLKRLGIGLFWLGAWQLLAMWVDNGILLATPLQALRTLWQLLGETRFWHTIGWSLLRIGTGFAAGTAAGLLLAAASARFRFLEEVLRPLIGLLKAVPVASFVVLLLIWWGSSFLAVAVCFLIVLPGIYIGMLEGIKNTDKKLLEMAWVFRLSKGARFFYIYRPALRPFLMSSLRLALGMCWKSGVAAEVIGTPDFSIGERLYLSKIYLDTAGVFAWTVVVILLSIGFEKLILWLAGVFFAWEPQVRGQRRCSGMTGSVTGKSAVTVIQEADTKGGCGGFVCSHVDKAYGGLKVLQEFSFVYQPGECYVLDSPSGSGKTTTLRLLAGLERPDEGEILRCRNVSAMVFQEDRLCEDYSAVQNVALVTGDRAYAREALERLLPGEALNKPCRDLSGGMKRRVALVRAMEAKSDAVLLDEPFTGLDADNQAIAEAYIKEKQRCRTLIIATHIKSTLGQAQYGFVGGKCHEE